jgi:cytochrome c-type biogenesis protein CcmF
VAAIGSWALALSLVVSLYGAIAALVGARQKSRPFVESAERAVAVVAVLATAASALLLYLLVNHDFQVQYVHQYTSTHLPLIYRISAFWAGEAGSLLLWFWLQAIITLAVVRLRGRHGQSGPYLLATMAASVAFFALLLIGTANPFATYASRPAEGIGMLPLLENPGMVIHPPVLFLGYAGYTVPFAFALAALLSGELDSQWVKAMRRWSLFAWLALSLGILIGAWWSYVELGWGGYWAWDPVENASLIPWLVGTALLHSTIMQERRGMQKVWNLVLPTLAFVLCLFATLVTRGGIIVSELHGFSSSIQPIAYYLLAFIAVALGGTFALIYLRRDRLASEREVGSLLSREGSFLLVELLFCGAALIVFLGTVYPSLARSFLGALVGLNASFYNRAVGPVMAVIIILMGICPVIGWQRISDKSLRNLGIPTVGALVLSTVAFILGITELFPLTAAAICSFVVLSVLSAVARDVLARHRSTGESHLRAFVRMLSKARRRYGAYLVHLAVVLVAVGVTGSSAYKSEELVALNPGEAIDFRGYRIQYVDYSVETINPEPVTRQSRVRYAAALGVQRGQSKAATVVAEKNYHWALETPWVTEVAIKSSLKEDLYIILASLEQNGLAGFQFVLNPLVSWIWIGGGLLLVGTLMAVWPEAHATKEED